MMTQLVQEVGEGERIWAEGKCEEGVEFIGYYFKPLSYNKRAQDGSVANYINNGETPILLKLE